MLRLLIPLLIVLILAVGGFFLFQNLQTKPVSQSVNYASDETSPTPIPTLATLPSQTTSDVSGPCVVLINGSDDVPALYSGVKWDEATITSKEIIEYDENYNESVVLLEGCVTMAKGISSEQADKFDDAYFSEFEKHGWKLVNDFAGPDGSLITHKKQNKYILIEKRIDPNYSSNNTMKYNIEIFYSQ